MHRLPELTDEAWDFVLRPTLGEGRVLVVGRRKHGCAGWSYLLSRHREVPPGHLAVTAMREDGPATVAVTEADLPHLSGARARLEQVALGQRLVWDNPQEEDRCGCGASILTRP